MALRVSDGVTSGACLASSASERYTVDARRESITFNRLQSPMVELSLHTAEKSHASDEDGGFPAR
jgi:hypothetical protein